MRDCLEALLEGRFLCLYTHKEHYTSLCDAAFLDEVNALLKPLGREVRRTEGDSAFYCAYLDPEDPRDARTIRSQFERLRDQIGPVIKWLQLVMNATGRDASLISGEEVRFHDLLARIEQHEAYKEDLRNLGRGLFKKVSQVEKTRDRLQAVLDALETEGYVTLANRESSYYVVTGKMEFFYSTLEFVIEHEEIPLEEAPGDEQREMML